MLPIVQVASNITIALDFIFVFTPSARPMLQALSKISIVLGAIAPSVDSLAMRLPVLILSDVFITIGEEISTFAMLQASFPLSIVAVTYSTQTR